MATEMRTKDQLAVIRQDASKVMKDIHLLSTHLREAGLDRAAEVGTEVSRSLKGEVNQFKKVTNQVRSAVRSRAKAVDKTVKSNPYAVIGGALGIGLLVGRLLAIFGHKEA